MFTNAHFFFSLETSRGDGQATLDLDTKKEQKQREKQKGKTKEEREPPKYETAKNLITSANFRLVLRILVRKAVYY